MERQDDTERVLILARRRDAELASEVLVQNGFEAHICRSRDELVAEVAKGTGCAVVAEESLTPAVILSLSKVLEGQPPWSDLPFVVFSGRRRHPDADEPLRSLGNLAVLDRPTKIRSVVSAVSGALRARRRQYDAKRAIEKRDQFLAMLGHELRNPLGAIMLATEMQKLNGSAARPDNKQQEIIERQVRHLARLVDDLLDVSRVTSGKVVLKRTLLDLTSLLGRCVESIKGKSRHQVVLDARLPAGLMVDGDPVRLEQVFTNLLVNAVKYSPAGSTIHIDARLSQAGHVVVSVRDAGIGIAPEMLGRIFEMFAQIDTSLERAQGGMGIGLTLVKSLVELHGGAVEAHSEGLGRGSEFVVRLPPAAGATVADEGAAAASRLPSRVRVVLVEDNPDIRETCKDALESLGCEVEVAENGPSGVERILSTRPDIALVDIGLPGLDGYEVSRRVRAMGCAVRLVALSGYGSPEDHQRARVAGFDQHLTKPVSLPMLRETLAVALP